MKYRKVFEITEKGYDITTFVPLIMFCAILILILLNIRFNKEKRKKGMLFFIVLDAILFPIAIVVIFGAINQRNKIKQIYKEKSYSVVTGEVGNFHALIEGENEFENFTVNGIYFEYADANQVYGFNDSYGPIVGNEQKVRICYIAEKNYNRILKVETDYE